MNRPYDFHRLPDLTPHDAERPETVLVLPRFRGLERLGLPVLRALA